MGGYINSIYPPKNYFFLEVPFESLRLLRMCSRTVTSFPLTTFVCSGMRLNFFPSESFAIIFLLSVLYIIPITQVELFLAAYVFLAEQMPDRRKMEKGGCVF